MDEKKREIRGPMLSYELGPVVQKGFLIKILNTSSIRQKERGLTHKSHLSAHILHYLQSHRSIQF